MLLPSLTPSRISFHFGVPLTPYVENGLSLQLAECFIQLQS